MFIRVEIIIKERWRKIIDKGLVKTIKVRKSHCIGVNIITMLEKGRGKNREEKRSMKEGS